MFLCAAFFTSTICARPSSSKWLKDTSASRLRHGDRAGLVVLAQRVPGRLLGHQLLQGPGQPQFVAGPQPRLQVASRLVEQATARQAGCGHADPVAVLAEMAGHGRDDADRAERVGQTEVARRSGQVQIASELWTAELAEGEQALPRGARVEVVEVQGVRLRVRAVR